MDILTIITWEPATDTWKIYTNAKDEALEEILAAYIHSKVGSGGKDEPKVDRKRYDVGLGLWLEDDSFGTRHNCGSFSLALGLVVEAWRRLPIKAEPLSAYEKGEGMNLKEKTA